HDPALRADNRTDTDLVIAAEVVCAVVLAVEVRVEPARAVTHLLGAAETAVCGVESGLEDGRVVQTGKPARGVHGERSQAGYGLRGQLCVCHVTVEPVSGCVHAGTGSCTGALTGSAGSVAGSTSGE